MQSRRQDSQEMATFGHSSSPATEPNRGPAVDPERIQSLENDLALEQTILASLEDTGTSSSAEDAETVRATKLKILELKKQLSEAQGNPPKVPPMVGYNWSEHLQLPTRSLYGSSGISTPGGSSLSGSNHASLSRKRSFSNAQMGQPTGYQANKSQRTTPSPMDSTDQLHPSPDFFDGLDDDAFTVIDLTAPDDVLKNNIRKQREEEERMRRKKEAEDRDAEVARRLDPWSSSQAPQPRTVFDRMTGRSSQSSQAPGHARPYQVKHEQPPLASTSQASRIHTSAIPQPAYAHGQGSSRIQSESSFTPYRSVFGQNGFKPLSQVQPQPQTRVKPEPQPQQSYHRPHIPGSWVEDDDDLVFLGQSNRNNQSLPSIGALGVVPSSSGPSQTPSQPLLGFDRYNDDKSPFHTFQPSLNYSQPPPNYNQLATAFELPTSRPGHLSNGTYSDYTLPRPPLPGFSSLSDLTKRVSSYDFKTMTNGVGEALPSHLASYIDDFVHDPRKTDEEIQQLLSNIRPDMDIPEEARGETPAALRYPLYVHQQLALKWMIDMEKGKAQGGGGILADDMGLGKTISTLALMVSRPSEDENVKTNLIIGPVALIRQWEHEIKKKLKAEHQLNVFLLYGKKAKYSEIKKADVVLTTYGSVASEWKRYNRHLLDRADADGYNAFHDEELHKKCPLLHPKSEFYRVILDEAQLIKNKDTQSSQGCHQITAVYRWCLTGTPMMNGVLELYPLMRFLRAKPFHTFKKFSDTFKSLTPKSKADDQQRSNAMKQLQLLLKATMLRRMKNSLIDGKPILTLPEKTEHTESVEFSPDEMSFYKNLEERSQVQFNKYLRAGTVGKNYSNILVLLLRLRQACCHPHLMAHECVAATETDDDKMLELAKSLEKAVVERIKAIKAFECPICYDAVEDATILVPCGHDTCSECFASLSDNATQNDIRSGLEGGSAKCPVCRGPADTSKTITYTAFRKVYMPEEKSTIKELDEDSKDSDTVYSDSDSDDESVATVDSDESFASLKDFIVKDGEFDEEEARDRKPQKVKSETKTKKSKDRRKKAAPRSSAKGKEKTGAENTETLKVLRHEAGKNKEARRKYMRYLRDHWLDSAKVTKVLELLEEIQKTDEKTIIFSQWTTLLDLIECQIKYKLQAKYCRYTGGMSRKHRDESVQDFVENDRTKIMLVSLRAGNAGLNLTVASHVIICDPFWNPYIEMQAVDRAHRIGQQREVQVHRILIEGTVEDRILELKEKKRELVDAALDEGESKSLGRLSVRELAYLFTGRR
ncbi:ATP-dependent helicase ULS1 [Rhypophila decipiens]